MCNVCLMNCGVRYVTIDGLPLCFDCNAKGEGPYQRTRVSRWSQECGGYVTSEELRPARPSRDGGSQ